MTFCLETSSLKVTTDNLRVKSKKFTDKYTAIVFVGANTFINVIIRTAQSLNPKLLERRYHIASTVEEAREKIKQLQSQQALTAS